MKAIDKIKDIDTEREADELHTVFKGIDEVFNPTNTAGNVVQFMKLAVRTLTDLDAKVNLIIEYIKEKEKL